MSEAACQPELQARAGEKPGRCVVIGCGYTLAGDDGVGLEIIQRLEDQRGPACELRAMPQAGIDLLETWQGAERILFVDAVSSGAPAGTLYLAPLPWKGLEPRSLGALSTHGWGLAESLALAEALGRRLPRMMLLGVEIANVVPGSGLSPEVERAVEVVVKNFPRLASQLVKGDALPGPRRFRPGDASFPGE